LETEIDISASLILRGRFTSGQQPADSPPDFTAITHRRERHNKAEQVRCKDETKIISVLGVLADVSG